MGGTADSGQSHAYLFLLYSLVLFATIKWHEKGTMGWAITIGFIIGLAMISRPTEAIMLFIPLLWNTHTKQAAREKWAMVKGNKGQIAAAVLAGFIAILPQLIYWKTVSGSWVYDVGSKWVFLNPWFRVLVGWEKGWFIYTPITVFFIAGLFFVKKFPFRKSVITFCLLNIWIIIAWDDWQYGGSYSTRALVQSYPVLALPLTAFINHASTKRWKYIFYVMASYLLLVNIFQTIQYDSTILHYREMNRKYYSRIYLNPNPSPLDMSLLDTEDWLARESKFRSHILVEKTPPVAIAFQANERATILENIPISEKVSAEGRTVAWLKIEATIIAPDALWEAALKADLKLGDSSLHRQIRLFNPVGEQTGKYAFYLKVPEYFRKSQLTVYIQSSHNFTGTVSNLRVTTFQ